MGKVISFRLLGFVQGGGEAEHLSNDQCVLVFVNMWNCPSVDILFYVHITFQKGITLKSMNI